VEMPGQLISNDIDVMADGIRHGLGIGRLFEPIWRLAVVIEDQRQDTVVGNKAIANQPVMAEIGGRLRHPPISAITG
jgi:hypothetical protein